MAVHAKRIASGPAVLGGMKCPGVACIGLQLPLLSGGRFAPEDSPRRVVEHPALPGNLPYRRGGWSLLMRPMRWLGTAKSTPTCFSSDGPPMDGITTVWCLVPGSLFESLFPVLSFGSAVCCFLRLISRLGLTGSFPLYRLLGPRLANTDFSEWKAGCPGWIMFNLQL